MAPGVVVVTVRVGPGGPGTVTVRVPPDVVTVRVLPGVVTVVVPPGSRITEPGSVRVPPGSVIVRVFPPLRTVIVLVLPGPGTGFFSEIVTDVPLIVVVVVLTLEVPVASANPAAARKKTIAIAIRYLLFTLEPPHLYAVKFLCQLF